MTREEAINEINKAFTSAYANYIVTALTEGATVSDIQHRWGRAYEAGVKDGLEQKPCEDAVSRSEIKRIAKEMYLEVANMEFDAKTISDCISCASSKCREVLERKLQALPSVTPQEPKTGHWIENYQVDFGEWQEYDVKLSDGFVTDNCHCSECGEELLSGDRGMFCPYCGADMREVEVEDGNDD